MGCWYETCGLSGLPITPRVPTALLLIAPGRDYYSRNHNGTFKRSPGGFSYPNGTWTPVCPPIFGTYNDDIGTINLKKQPAHWALTEAHLKGYTINASFSDKFFERVERGKVIGSGQGGHGLYGMDLPGGDFPLGQMLIRKDIWDFLLATPIESWHGPINHEGCRKDARTLVDYVLKKAPKSERDTFHWMFDTDRHFEEQGPSPFFSAVFGPDRIAGYCKHALIDGLLKKTVKPEEALAIFDEIGDLGYIHILMHPLRRAYRPQPGKGSQDIHYDLHEKLALKVAEIAKRENEED